MSEMGKFLTRRLPPCPVTGCDGNPRPDFHMIGNSTDSMLAIYRCDDCGAVWDHKGQPMRSGAPRREVTP